MLMSELKFFKRRKLTKHDALLYQKNCVALAYAFIKNMKGS